MVEPIRCWRREYTGHSDHGHGLYATQDIPKGKTILSIYPEVVIHPNTLDGQRYSYIPDDAVFSNGISKLDEFHTSRQRAILGKKPQVLYVSSTQPPKNFKRKARETSTSRADELEIILVIPSLVNHSCAPNMFRVDSTSVQTRRLKCRFVAIRNIKIGEQLTILYNPESFNWEYPHTRRALLSKEYGFFCRCLKCVSQSGWADLMPLSSFNRLHVNEDGMNPKISTLPLISKESIHQEITLEGSNGIKIYQLDGAGGSEAIIKAPRRERVPSWLGITSSQARTWLRHVPAEVKGVLKNKKDNLDGYQSGSIVALDDNRNEDGSLSSKVFRVEDAK